LSAFFTGLREAVFLFGFRVIIPESVSAIRTSTGLLAYIIKFVWVESFGKPLIFTPSALISGYFINEKCGHDEAHNTIKQAVSMNFIGTACFSQFVSNKLLRVKRRI
jgi:hypothetical protein